MSIVHRKNRVVGLTHDEQAMRVVCSTLGFEALAQGIDPQAVVAAIADQNNPLLRPALLAYHRALLRLAETISREEDEIKRARRRIWLDENRFRAIPPTSGRATASASFRAVLPCGRVVRKRSHGIQNCLGFIGCFTDGKQLFPNIVAPEATEDGHPIYYRHGLGVDQIAVLAIREG